MKRLSLTQGKFAIVDDADYEHLVKHKWFAFKGSCTFYAARQISRSSPMLMMHRYIMKTEKGFETDHINHNGLDNRRCNLRNVTRRENAANLRNHGTSKYVGVSWEKGRNKWKASISVNGKVIHLGLFLDEVEAYKAYQKTLRIYLETGCIVRDVPEPKLYYYDNTRNKWAVSVKEKGKTKNLGRYKTEEEAKAVVLEYKKSRSKVEETTND